MNTYTDPWAIPTPSANREDIFERGTITRAQLTQTEDEER